MLAPGLCLPSTCPKEGLGRKLLPAISTKFPSMQASGSPCLATLGCWAERRPMTTPPAHPTLSWASPRPYQDLPDA